MNSGTLKPGLQSKTGPGGVSAAVPSNQAILRDKLNVRRSTPDSEALASSDDESDVHRQDSAPSSVLPSKPARRSSWLNDTSQPVAPPRKGSFASSTMSPTTSHPSTPAAEAGVGTWGSHSTSSVLNRGHPGTSSFPWGTGIWNNERKEPPLRLQEVLPSPTSCMPPGNAFLPNENGLAQSLPVHKDHASNPQIPFAIPLHPTPKTYRSQSYSVGQLEPDVSGASSSGQSILGGRGRMLGHSGLQHRPSRPSMLSEMASDGSMLGKVTEDDDDEGSNESMPGNQHQSSEAAKTIEMLARENAMLRQQQYQNSRHRPRASTAAAFNLGNGHLQDPVPEESEYAIDELDEGNDGTEFSKRSLGRRMSEYGAVPFRTPLLAENRKLENVKKGFWQTSLGFGVSGLAEIPQSRRHSFADVPTRQGSISSIGEAAGVHEAAAQEASYPDYSSTYPDNANYSGTHSVPAYFNGSNGMHGLQSPVYSNPYGLGYAALSPYAHIPSSPTRNMYGMAAPRHNQTLHIVLFKCARADVFYIQEGTGLTVKPGDLVIVEADRGTDLGTVAKDNVDWQTAKDLKEHYAEEQYKWLMMYSHNAAAAQDGAGAGLLAGSSGLQASAVGGMGPPSQHHIQESSSGELKPKLIKRLAQSHEIHALRDKEGNEAKAKRVCTQKVKEHGLNMEILDAEFQMDWKKLTFYYFADSYINFNSLVTDLFKIYKTRIWMSAINPASFASPTLGLQAPSGIGPGAVGVGRGSSAAHRRQDQQQDPQTNYGGTTQAARGAQPSYGQSFPADRTSMTTATASYPVSGYAYNPYGAFGNAARPGTSPFGPAIMAVPDTFAPGFSQASARFAAPQASGGQLDQGGLSLGTQSDWVTGAFQGLSLNSR